MQQHASIEKMFHAVNTFKSRSNRKGKFFEKGEKEHINSITNFPQTELF